MLLYFTTFTTMYAFIQYFVLQLDIQKYRVWHSTANINIVFIYCVGTPKHRPTGCRWSKGRYVPGHQYSLRWLKKDYRTTIVIIPVIPIALQTLTYFGLLIRSGNKVLGQNWLIWWRLALTAPKISWTNFDVSTNVMCQFQSKMSMNLMPIQVSKNKLLE